MSWAVGYHEKLSSSIHHIEAQGGKEFNALAEWLPAVKLVPNVNCPIDNTAKTKLVLPVLVNQRARHKALILDWALDVVELWDLFHGGDNWQNSWFNLMDHIADQTDQIAEHNEAPQAVDGGNNADADDVVEMLDPTDVMAMLNLGAGDNNAGGNTDNNNVNP
ncbi:hypothetical protein PCASD_25227 [Puccinia coronata f. sp. avenae]|uniref:Uncharacterized protein n=1 Tax=Puccinia coronata f. sp. avenae TaxID=200324 RepID=A0A2N5TJ28_9BASI|nr:hypothetical protein PCASD_25227 [Puccinia coronata f. sp. avenae]